jgi:hypothetical protein
MARPAVQRCQTLISAAASTALSQAQLEAHLRTLSDNQRLLARAVNIAEADQSAAASQFDGARALWSAAQADVQRRRDALQQPIDWGGIVVVGLFKVVGFVLSLYEPAAGKLVSSVPDYLVLGNTAVTVSPAEITILTKAIESGGTAVQGLKSLITSTGEVSWAAVADNAGQVVLGFTKFLDDLDDADGDPDLTRLVKELMLRLQETLVARGRVESAARNVALARERAQAALAEQARYAALYARAQQDVSVRRATAQALLGIVRRYGDLLLREQFKAARAVEIYRLTDESAAMAADRWHLHPDTERDYTEELIDSATYASRLALSATDLSIINLRDDYNKGAIPDLQRATHYVTINDPTRISQFRQQLTTTFQVLPEDLAGDRFRATVISAALTLDGATAATPSFSVPLIHGGRCAYLLPDGTSLTQVLEPRFELIEVATTGSPGTATGAIAADADRVQHFWRRAIATQWTIRIEPEILTDDLVDLSRLTAIRVAMRYEAVTKLP